MLDYTNIGTAQVKVEYVGRAPLDGDDDQYLMASYHPSNRAPDPSDGLPTGVMVAMNGPSPSLPVGATAVPFPGQLTDSGTVQPVMPAQSPAYGDLALPDFGPIVPERPEINLPPQSPFAVASLSYADERVERASNAFAALGGEACHRPTCFNRGSGSRRRLVRPTMSRRARSECGGGQARCRSACAFGKIEIQRSELDGEDWYSVNLYPDGHRNLDDLLQAASRMARRCARRAQLSDKPQSLAYLGHAVDPPGKPDSLPRLPAIPANGSNFMTIVLRC